MTVVRVTLYGAIFGQKTQNVFHFQRDNATAAHVTQLLTDFRNGLVNPWSGRCLNNQQFNRTNIRTVTTEGYAPIDTFYTQTGTVGSSVFNSPITAFLIRIGSATGGPTGRGRIYFPGAGAGGMTEGRWLNTVQNAWSVILNGTMATFGPGGTNLWRIGIFPRAGGGNEAFKFATSLLLRDVVSVQRRRNINVGD